MITKEMVKHEIDKMPIEMVTSVYQFIVEEESNRPDKKSFYLNLLLNGPIIDDDELGNISTATEMLNSWNLEKY